jgi:hypothetical protein
MNQQEGEEEILRFLQMLSAKYDGGPTMRPSLGTYPQPLVLYESQRACVVTGLSLPNEDIDSSINKNDRVNIQKRLLSRKGHYDQPSIASSTLLRNLISSFGKILEMELQSAIYLKVCELDKLDDSKRNRKKKDAFLKAFEKQSQRKQSPALPLSAAMKFHHDTFGVNKNLSGQIDHRGNVEIDITFEAQILLHLIPNSATVTSRMKAPAKISFSRSAMDRTIHEFDVGIDVDILYDSIQNDCHQIAKVMINAIVGYSVFKTKKGSRKKKQDPAMEDSDKAVLFDDESHKSTASTVASELPSPSRSSVAHVDDITRATVANTDDLNHADSVEGSEMQQKEGYELSRKVRSSEKFVDEPDQKLAKRRFRWLWRMIKKSF